jgi:hypothetical protein
VNPPEIAFGGGFSQPLEESGIAGADLANDGVIQGSSQLEWVPIRSEHHSEGALVGLWEAPKDLFHSLLSRVLFDEGKA